MAEHTVVIDGNLIRGSTGSHFRQQPYHFCKVIRILATAASPHTQRRAILSQSGAVILYPSREQKTIICAHGPPRHHRREIQCLSSVVKIDKQDSLSADGILEDQPEIPHLPIICTKFL